MDRRRFLRLSVAVPTLLQARPAAGLPVVVVGAGLAGLRAAAMLRQAGRQVVVLEAREHAGGRVRTVRSPFDDGLYGEAGAIRIAPAHRTVLRLAREYRLPLLPFEPPTGAPVRVGPRAPVGAASDSSDLRADERAVGPAALLNKYVGVLPADLSEPAATAASYAGWRDYDRMAWPEWLRSRGASPAAVTLMTLGGDARQVSALYVLRQFAMLGTSRERYKIAGGMDRLPHAMAMALGDAVQYGAAVVRVQRRAASAFRVEYQTGTRMRSLDAGRIIFAIPLTTLRQIEMRPRLSRAKERVIESVGYYPGARILLQTRTRFWNRAGHNGTARTARATEVWDCSYDRTSMRQGLLGASTGGVYGQEMQDMTPEQSVAFGVDLVADAFPGVRDQMEKGTTVCWGTEPWSRGAFAAFAPGQMTSMMPDIATPEEGIHFAGEHTSPWMGWMEGALESGERAAREIIAG